MKIVTRAEFLKMPPGTVFSKYEPCFFGELSIKGETWLHEGCPWIGDFLYISLNDGVHTTRDRMFNDVLDEAQQTGCSVVMDLQTESRDGLFDTDQLFAVWEPADVTALIERLQEAQEESKVL